MSDSQDHGKRIVTRFAPSPTGHLHIGGVRTALFCYAFARRHGGSFLLRVEDTDAVRSTEDAAAGILRDLAWVGIPWDEGPRHIDEDGEEVGGDPRGVGPFHQSQRRETYERYFAMLIEAGLAYPAFDTPEELAAMRQEAEKAKRTFRYTQPSGYDQAAALARMNAGEEHVLRLRASDEPVTVADEVMGSIEFTSEHFDDFIIRKRDGMPTYHFAVVVDDALMGVTHVLRGQEHLNNTPRHVKLMTALGSVEPEKPGMFDPPTFAHLPLISNEKGGKMSKRERDVTAKAACRERGMTRTPTPEAVDEATFATWVGDKKSQLDPLAVDAIAVALGLDLPEVSVHDFRRAGYLPDVIINFLALLGWSPSSEARAELKAAAGGADTERFDMDFLVKHFDLGGIAKSSARFDRDKLLAFNADTIQHEMSDDEFGKVWRDWLRTFEPALLDDLERALGVSSADEWTQAAGTRASVLVRAARPRAKTLCDAIEAVRFVLLDAESIEYEPKAVKKALRKGDPSGLVVLPALREHLASAEKAWRSGADAIEAAVKAFVDAGGAGDGANMGKAAQPLRVALTGTAVSPPLGETLAFVGKEETLRRIDRCVEANAQPTE